MADFKFPELTPLQSQHTPNNSPVASEYQVSQRDAGFPSAPVIYPQLHTRSQLIPGNMPVKKFHELQTSGTKRTTYSVQVHTPNCKMSGGGHAAVQ